LGIIILGIIKKVVALLLSVPRFYPIH